MPTVPDHRSRAWHALNAWPLILVAAAIVTLLVTEAVVGGRSFWARLFLFSALSVFYYVCAVRVVEAQDKLGKWDKWLPSIHLLIKGTDHGALWTVLFFVPVVHIFMFMLISFKLTGVAGKSKVWGWLQLIPFVHVFALYYVVAAIQEKEWSAAAEASTSGGPEAAGADGGPRRP